MKIALAAVLTAGCAAPAVVGEPAAAIVSPPPPLVSAPPPPGPVALSAIGADDPADAPELAVAAGAPMFALRRVASGALRETWRLVEDGSRRVVRVVVDEEKAPGAWTEIAHAAWAGRADTKGAIMLTLVDRAGPLAWAPAHLEGTCAKAWACTEERPAVRRPARRCEVDIDGDIESVLLAAGDVGGTVTESCATPHVETRVYSPMRGTMRRGRDH